MSNTERVIKYTPFRPTKKAPTYTPKSGESAAKQELKQLKQWPGPGGRTKQNKQEIVPDT